MAAVEKEQTRNPEVCMVSGHMDLTDCEYAANYAREIECAAARGARFVVGHAQGADSFALAHLKRLGLGRDRVTVFLPKTSPHRIYDLSKLDFTVRVEGTSALQRDCAMTRRSTRDIAWIRSAEDQRILMKDKYDPSFVSGTQRNLDRRGVVAVWVDPRKEIDTQEALRTWHRLLDETRVRPRHITLLVPCAWLELWCLQRNLPCQLGSPDFAGAVLILSGRLCKLHMELPSPTHFRYLYHPNEL